MKLEGISKPDKVLYPDDDVTKADVAKHYAAVAEAMLPHLRDRPLTLRRYPDGIGAEGWFQKQAPDHLPDSVRVAEVPQRGGGKGHYVVCDNRETLAYLANQAALELHVWPAKATAPEHPDLLVIDLDPPDGTELKELRATARQVRDLYEAVGLTPFVQTTGGRGYHVVAPLDGTTGVDEVLGFARAAADHLAAQHDDRLTTALRKEKRGDRIFLDTNRNGYGQTFVAPYSLRARPGAPVAVPIEWSELGTAEPAGWTVHTARRRLAQKADPWRDLHSHATSAKRAHEQLRRLG